MKLNLSLVFLTTLFLSSHLFANEIYKGRLLSHKEWSTNKLSFHFDQSKKVASLINKPYQTTDNEDYITIFDVGHNANGSTGTLTQITHNAETMISNNSNSTKKYILATNICVDTGANTSQCAHRTDMFELSSYGFASFFYMPTLKFIFNSPGVYKTTVGTSLNTIDGGSDSISSFGTASVIIS